MTNGHASVTPPQATGGVLTAEPAMADTSSTPAVETVAAAMESPEEAAVVHEEIDGIGVVSRAQKRVIVRVIRFRVAAIVVAVGVAVVGIAGIRIRGGGVTFV